MTQVTDGCRFFDDDPGPRAPILSTKPYWFALAPTRSGGGAYDARSEIDYRSGRSPVAGRRREKPRAAKELGRVLINRGLIRPVT